MFARKKYWLVPVFLLLLMASVVVLSKGSMQKPPWQRRRAGARLPCHEDPSGRHGRLVPVIDFRLRHEEVGARQRRRLSAHTCPVAASGVAALAARRALLH